MFNWKRTTSSIVLATTLILVGCTAFDITQYQSMSAEDIYKAGNEFLDDKDYKRAAEVFMQLSLQHPYSKLASKSSLLAGYAYYEAKMYDEAVDAFRSFIETYPGQREEVAYAIYMIGQSYYVQMPLVERDQKIMEQAHGAFSEVAQKFPNSAYIKDVKYKLFLIEDRLAAKEMNIGRFYLSRANPLAALNRFKTVVSQYEKTSQAIEALYRVVECYHLLGIKDQARSTTIVLGHNFPESSWYRKAYELMKGDVPEPTKKEESKKEEKNETPTNEQDPHAAPLPPDIPALAAMDGSKKESSQLSATTPILAKDGEPKNK